MKTVSIESINDLKPGDRVVVADNLYASQARLTPGDVHTIDRVVPSPIGAGSGSVSLVGVGPNPFESAGQPGLYGFLIFDKVIEDAEHEAPAQFVGEPDDLVKIVHSDLTGHRFPAGEIVRITSTLGPEGTQTAEYTDHHDYWYVDPAEYVRIEDAEPEAPVQTGRFKVGDRVRCIQGGPGYPGLIGTVTATNNENERYPSYMVDWDSPPAEGVRQCDTPGGGAWQPTSLELIPEPAPLAEGDRAKIIANTSGHGFPIDTEVTLVSDLRDGGEPHFRAADDSGEKWYVNLKDLEPVLADADMMTEKEQGLEQTIASLSTSRDAALRHAEGLERTIADLRRDLETAAGERSALTQAASDERRRLVGVGEDLTRQRNTLLEEVDTLRRRVNDLAERNAALIEQGRRDTERNAALNEQVQTQKDLLAAAGAEVARMTRVLDYTRAECVADEAARQRSFGFEDGTRPA